MARKPENNFIARVNRLLPLKQVATSADARAKYPKLDWIHYEKNNNAFRGGTADCWYSGRRGDLWVEYKYLERLPQRSDVKPFELISRLQHDWLNGRLDEGRNVGVVIGCPTGGVVLLNRAWEREISPQEFCDLIRSAPDLAKWVLNSTVYNGGNTR